MPRMVCVFIFYSVKWVRINFMKIYPLLFLFLSSLASADTQCMQNYFASRVGETLEYRVEIDGIRAKGARAISQSDSGQFTLLQSVSVLLASLEEESHFIVDEQGIVPINYLFEQQGLGARKTTIQFNGATAEVNRKGKTSQLELPQGFQDPLTFILQLQAATSCGESIETLKIPLVKSKGVSEVVFVKGEDSLIKSRDKDLVLETWQRVDGDKIEKVGLIPELNNLLYSFEQREGEKINRLQLIDLP
ncbi:DUF3108 domain-containing protein [Marinobacterium sp. xm-m-383]|jgi:hypothetical protein|uniref:DUF3108 domain-containing protein n=2 Tax=unclassified Marinobacterium TaxID=2644139 RepID=UPI0019E6CB92|nr:hypothetical protein [Marinobacterium sp. xm-a-152]NRP52782.1 hypothetical protein [Marinobacterium sp. xm-v-242]NRP77363.1 hypothetical protein [Marinobacterium sp. xm-m-383]